MKKTLVTGGCGFIGYRLTQRLISDGFDVDVIDNLSIGPRPKMLLILGRDF